VPKFPFFWKLSDSAISVLFHHNLLDCYVQASHSQRSFAQSGPSVRLIRRSGAAGDVACSQARESTQVSIVKICFKTNLGQQLFHVCYCEGKSISPHQLTVPKFLILLQFVTSPGGRIYAALDFGFAFLNWEYRETPARAIPVPKAFIGESGVLKKRTDDTMTTTRLRELVTEWVTGDYSSQ